MYPFLTVCGGLAETWSASTATIGPDKDDAESVYSLQSASGHGATAHLGVHGERRAEERLFTTAHPANNFREYYDVVSYLWVLRYSC
jgi:hypothetical protein